MIRKVIKKRYSRTPLNGHKLNRRTTCCYGQFALSLGKVQTFSLNEICLIQTPVNADSADTFFVPNKQILLESQPHYYQQN